MASGHTVEPIATILYLLKFVNFLDTEMEIVVDQLQTSPPIIRAQYREFVKKSLNSSVIIHFRGNDADIF